MVRQHDNCMQKYKEGQRGELDFCIPLAVRPVLDQKDMSKVGGCRSVAGWGVGRKKYRLSPQVFLAQRCARHPNPHGKVSEPDRFPPLAFASSSPFINLRKRTELLVLGEQSFRMIFRMVEKENVPVPSLP